MGIFTCGIVDGKSLTETKHPDTYVTLLCPMQFASHSYLALRSSNPALRVKNFNDDLAKKKRYWPPVGVQFVEIALQATNNSALGSVQLPTSTAPSPPPPRAGYLTADPQPAHGIDFLCNGNEQTTHVVFFIRPSVGGFVRWPEQNNCLWAS